MGWECFFVKYLEAESDHMIQSGDFPTSLIMADRLSSEKITKWFPTEREDRMSKEKETGKEKRRIRQLARYYIPYKGLFFTDMFFAMLGAAITLVIPLIVRYITSTVVEKPLEQATGEIIRLGILMIAMVLVEMYAPNILSPAREK